MKRLPLSSEICLFRRFSLMPRWNGALDEVGSLRRITEKGLSFRAGTEYYRGTETRLEVTGRVPCSVRSRNWFFFGLDEFRGSTLTWQYDLRSLAPPSLEAGFVILVSLPQSVPIPAVDDMLCCAGYRFRFPKTRQGPFSPVVLYTLFSGGIGK